MLFAHLCGGGPDGESHVGAGVPVGDGEDVQVVNGLLLGIDGGVGVNHHPLKDRRVNILYHIGKFLSANNQKRMESTQTSTEATSTPVVLLTT